MVAIKRSVRVHLKDGKTIDGLLTSKRGKWIRLVKGSLVESEGASRPFDGEAVIPRENILFIQEL